MFANFKSSGRFGLLTAVLALVALPAAALAITVVAWAYDPTRTAVYYQFSTDVPFDAFRSDVRTPAGVVVSGPLLKNPPAMVSGGNGVHNGLTPATPYVLRVWVKEVPGGPWTLVRVQAFATNP